MKLNEQSKNKLRKKIEEQLQNVPDGQRVRFDKELLDDLIFFKGQNKDGLTIKVPIWTGKFLRKIDLSELSFENVCFKADGDYSKKIDDIMDAENVDRFYFDPKGEVYVPPVLKYKDDLEDEDYFNEFHYDEDFIDFSGTNIIIDFSKIYGDRIECTNFSGVDLSKSNFQCINGTDRSNFSYTGIDMDFKRDSSIDRYFRYTNFSDNDFSKNEVQSDVIMYYDNFDEPAFSYCNFANTGLKIKYIRDEHDRDDDYIGEVGVQLREYLKNGLLDHCYIDGKLIKTADERQTIAKEMKQEYEKIAEDFISSTISGVEEKISGFGKK